MIHKKKLCIFYMWDSNPGIESFTKMFLHTNRLFDIAVDTRAGLSLWGVRGLSSGGPVRDISKIDVFVIRFLNGRIYIECKR